MSKQDNLKEFLTDLYKGISFKKPGASRNPQHFRGEIESIVSGGESLPEYDGICVTTGTPTEEDHIETLYEYDGKCKVSGEPAEELPSVNTTPAFDGTIEIDGEPATDYTDYYEEGKTAGIAEGRQAQYDEFWDAFQNYGNRTAYGNAFFLWGEAAFYPKYNLIPTGNASSMFQQIKIKNFKQRLIDCGVTLDLSQATNVTYLFSVAEATHVPFIDTTSASSLASIFYNSRIVDIEKLKLKSDGSQSFSDSFKWCESLQNLIVEGTLGQNGFNLQWSTKLSKASITSIINSLSTTTSGLTVTLSLTAVNTAFETSAGAKNGSTSEEWTTFIAGKSNWNISLV